MADAANAIVNAHTQETTADAKQAAP
jgi:hypothetical protein